MDNDLIQIECIQVNRVIKGGWMTIDVQKRSENSVLKALYNVLMGNIEIRRENNINTSPSQLYRDCRRKDARSPSKALLHSQ